MEIIKSKFTENISVDRELVGKNACFLDIETTGLNRNKDIIYLIGVLYFDTHKNRWTLDQFFANELNKEKEMLLETMKLVSRFDRIINYNGNSFDIPFINHRLKINNIDSIIEKDLSLDIYSIIRSNRNLFLLENLKLKTIEEHLGIKRTDIYSGRDCIQFYKDYVVTKNRRLKDKILQHNYDDLYYLLQVVEILKSINKKKSFSLAYGNNLHKFLIDKIRKEKDFLKINGYVERSSFHKTMYFHSNHSIVINDDIGFKVELEVHDGLLSPSERCLFIDKNEYDIPDIDICNSNYKIPSNIILLQVDSYYMINNIKNVLAALIYKTLH